MPWSAGGQAFFFPVLSICVVFLFIHVLFVVEYYVIINVYAYSGDVYSCIVTK